MKLLNDVISRKDIVGGRIALDMVEHAFLFQIRDHLSFYQDHVDADILLCKVVVFSL